jgi:hypothetical protein
MTTIAFTAVPTAFALLGTTDFTVKDTDKIPAQGVELICPILFPDPGGWLSDVSEVRETMGVGGTGQFDLNYTLNYIYLHSPAGGNISDFDNYNAMIANIGRICTVVANNDTMGGVDDVTIQSVSTPGFIEAPDGVVFHGCRIALKVLEFV